MDLSIIDNFDTTIKEFIRLIETTPDSLLNKQPDEETWSVAQIGDHIQKTLQTLALARDHAVPSNRLPDEKVAQISAIFLNFNVKYKQEKGEATYPRLEPIDKAELISALRYIANEIVIFSKNNDLSLLIENFEVPFIGKLTRYEWLQLQIDHTKRHIHQIQHVKRYLLQQSA